MKNVTLSRKEIALAFQKWNIDVNANPKDYDGDEPDGSLKYAEKQADELIRLATT